MATEREPHEKRPHERVRDRKRIRQVALLWWSQRIYQAAHDTCSEGDPYTDHVKYVRVSLALRRLVAELNAMKTTPAPDRQLNLYQGLEDQKDRWEAKHYGGPGTSGNCTDDDDCPDDYICVETVCEYLLPEG